MKPTDVLLNAAKVKNTIKTSRAVAKMVKKYKMHDQVLAISFNYYATISAKRVSKTLLANHCTFHSALIFYPPLPSKQYCFLKVKLWSNNNQTLIVFILSQNEIHVIAGPPRGGRGKWPQGLKGPHNCKL